MRTAVSSGSSQDLQDEYDRLVKAGKKPDTVKTEITKAAKPDYVDGSDYDREQMAEMLLALTDRDGNALYEQKNLDDWMKQAEKNAEKEAQKENEVDVNKEHPGGRKWLPGCSCFGRKSAGFLCSGVR